MAKRKLGFLNNSAIKTMIKEDLIDEDYYKYEINQVGNYLTTIFPNKYNVQENDSTQEAFNKRRNLIEAFGRMRKKYRYAFVLNTSINEKTNEIIYPLKVLRYDKRAEKFKLFDEKEGEYPRVIFSNTNFENEGIIELHPEYYQPNILKQCLYDMKNTHSDYEYIDTIYDYIEFYSAAKEGIAVPSKYLNELESRYIFYQTPFNPYKRFHNPEFEKCVYPFNDMVEFDVILDYFKISKKDFYNITQKPKASDGMFTKELIHLKKYLTLKLLFNIGIYPESLNKKDLSPSDYEKAIKEFLSKDMVFYELRSLYKILTLPYKRYEPLRVYTKKYRMKFNYFLNELEFSKSKTQSILRRYRYITDLMEKKLPIELLDMVNIFLANYKYIPNSIFGENTIEEEYESFVAKISTSTSCN